MLTYNFRALKEEDWAAWAQDDATVPSFSSDPFPHLLIAVILRPKGTSSYLVTFVKATIGDQYLESGTIIVADVHSFSSPNDPIVFLLGSRLDVKIANI